MSAKLIDFLDKAKYCKNVEELSELAQRTFDLFGFPMWAYQTKSELLMTRSEPILIHNFPRSWETYYTQNNCTNVDPVITYGSNQTRPFQWSEITAHVDFNHTELEYQNASREHGMNDGLAIPIIGGNGRTSMLSLTTDIENEGLSSLLRVYHTEIVAITFAFHTIAKDLIKDNQLVADDPELTEREKECLLWASKGKSLWEIGMIIGISERTVKFHLDNARKKYKVPNIQNLIIHAIARGHIKI